jgi:hypothetical protein
MKAVVACALLLLTSACADLEPQVGCLEVEGSVGTPCPVEAGETEGGGDARSDGSRDGGVDAGRKPSDAGKSEERADARE